MSSNLPATVSDDTPDLFSDARIQLIRDNIAKDAPEHVFRAMLEIARVRNLDPLAKQISVIQYGKTWQITTTIDGYRAIAEATGTYAGSDEPQFGPATIKLKSGKYAPEWASVTVWKFAHGQRVPFSERVYWDEYDGDNFTWNKMPRTMLAKVAESHALRKGFPKVLSGLYTGEEMDQAGPATVVDHATGEIIDAPQTPRIAPRRAQARSPWDDAIQIAAKHQVTEESLYEYFTARCFDPPDVNPDILAKFAFWCGQHTTAQVQRHIRDVISQSNQPPAPPRDGAGLDTDDGPASGGMDDADYAQVVASIETDAAPVSGGAGNDAWTN